MTEPHSPAPSPVAPGESDLCDCGHAWAEHGYVGCHHDSFFPSACKCSEVNPAAFGSRRTPSAPAPSGEEAGA